MRLACLAFLIGACDVARIDVVVGTEDNHSFHVRPGDEITLRMEIGDRTYDCGIWLVNNFVGGYPAFGVIDDCGHYVAPAEFADNIEVITIEAIMPGVSHACGECDQDAYATFTTLR
jgi:hypothetical protein